MMKTKFLVLAAFLPLFVSAQQTCKVLLPALDSVYSGKCKNGLANGYGEAWGKFHYTGKFAEGYPEGEGKADYPDGSVYSGHWKKGMRDGKGSLTKQVNGKAVMRTWMWENDVMKQEILPPPYKIVTQRNITRIRIYKQGNGNSVWFYPNSTGGVASDFEDFQLSGSSGSETNNNPKLGYESVTFPFRGSIRYKAWNKLRTTQFEVLVEVEISEPGNWIVEMQN